MPSGGGHRFPTKTRRRQRGYGRGSVRFVSFARRSRPDRELTTGPHRQLAARRDQGVPAARKWVAACIWLLACKLTAGVAAQTVHSAATNECRRGSHRRGGSMCVPLVAPANAHVDSSEHDWECDQGYRKKLNTCERVKDPAAAAQDGSPQEKSKLTQFRTSPGLEIAVFGRCGYHVAENQGSRGNKPRCQ
jgi:hypothetical protein